MFVVVTVPRIKLEAKRLPGRWVVTDEAVAEFIED